MLWQEGASKQKQEKTSHSGEWEIGCSRAAAGNTTVVRS
jgi:hypothetical protein